jgi:hypothetical protein
MADEGAGISGPVSFPPDPSRECPVGSNSSHHHLKNYKNISEVFEKK